MVSLPYADEVADRQFSAILWDFGGVIVSSPFEAFNRYELDHGLPHGFIRSVNTHNPLDNAWARLERSDISPSEFDALFAEESEHLGHRIQGREVLSLLVGTPRSRMVNALDRTRESGYTIACLTNNVSASRDDGPDAEASTEVQHILGKFHHVVESSKIGVRKPEPRFYEIACATVGATPSECVFLDDLGINLKPAAALGMHTIKVVDPDVALDELAELLKLPL